MDPIEGSGCLKFALLTGKVLKDISNTVIWNIRSIYKLTDHISQES
jgi:hypothetical protein